MNFPFDAIPGADRIRELSRDIIPGHIRRAQKEFGVPSLSDEGCRFINICARAMNPSVILDIGCGAGASTAALAMGAPFASITAIDSNSGRSALCREMTSSFNNIEVIHINAFDYLTDCCKTFDFVFVDSVKREYAGVWHLLRPLMNKGGLVVFDDVLLYGYTFMEEALTPLKYQEGACELRLFLSEVMSDKSVVAQILPLGGGMLSVSV